MKLSYNWNMVNNLELHSNKYYEVIVTDVKVEGEDERIPLYGVLNKETGIIEEKLKNYPSAVEVAEELNSWMLEHNKKQTKKGVDNVTTINRSNDTLQ